MSHLKKISKGLPVLLALQLGILPLTALAAFFPDVQGSWAQHAIRTLSEQGIITGYPDGSFHPQGSVTRAEFSAMLIKALGLKPNTPNSPSFSDVPSGNWAFTAVETVHAAGLVQGYPNGEFKPMKSISRAEAMAILANAAPTPSSNNRDPNQILNDYRDAASIPSWARPSVAATIQSGIFANNPANGNNIEPLEPATRADVAEMVENLRERLNIASNGQETHHQASDYGKATYDQSRYQGSNQQQTLQGHVSVIPADTRFTGTLNGQAISSELNQVGDKVKLIVNQPLVSSDNQVVVPVGSEILGRISQVQPAGHIEKAAVMDIVFYRIVTPDGQHYSIQGSIATPDGQLHGNDTKGRILKAAETTAIGAGLGAVLGTAMGPLSGGHVGKGAIYGTAVGAGAGAVAATVQKGKPVTLKSGDQLQIKLDQPLSVNSP